MNKQVFNPLSSQFDLVSETAGAAAQGDENAISGDTLWQSLIETMLRVSKATYPLWFAPNATGVQAEINSALYLFYLAATNQINNLTSKSHDANTDNTLLTPDKSKAVVYVDNGGTVHIDGNINQTGYNYESHATKIFTENDFITMRDGAIAGLGIGELSGLLVKKYDGVKDLHLCVDKNGVARLGDVGDERPFLLREENPTANWLLKWDGSTHSAKSIDPTYAFIVPDDIYFPPNVVLTKPGYITHNFIFSIDSIPAGFTIKYADGSTYIAGSQVAAGVVLSVFANAANTTFFTTVTRH